MATTHIISPVKTGNRLCTLIGGTAVYNRSAIMRRAWSLYRREVEICALLKAEGRGIGDADPFANHLRQAWKDAKAHVGDLRMIERHNASSPARQRVAMLEAKTRLGPRGRAALDAAHRACAAAAA